NDPGINVTVIGNDSRLAAGEADCTAAKIANRHGKQRHRDALAHGEEQVQFAAFRIGRHLLREFEQVIGRIPHRRHDDHNLVAQIQRAHHALCYAPNLFRISNAASAVFLYDNCHTAASQGDCRKTITAAPNESSWFAVSGDGWQGTGRHVLNDRCLHTRTGCSRWVPTVGWARLELATNALKGRCSTIELPTRLPSRRGGEVRVRNGLRKYRFQSCTMAFGLLKRIGCSPTHTKPVTLQVRWFLVFRKH